MSTAWHDVCGISDEQLAGQIRGDRVDILFDLAGHTRNVCNFSPANLLQSRSPGSTTWAQLVWKQWTISWLIPGRFLPAAEPWVPGKGYSYAGRLHLLRSSGWRHLDRQFASVHKWQQGDVCPSFNILAKMNQPYDRHLGSYIESSPAISIDSEEPGTGTIQGTAIPLFGRMFARSWNRALINWSLGEAGRRRAKSSSVCK